MEEGGGRGECVLERLADGQLGEEDVLLETEAKPPLGKLRHGLQREKKGEEEKG